MTHTYTATAVVVWMTAGLFAQSWGVWQPEADLPTAGEAKTHAIALEHTGTIYALGGPPWMNPQDLEDPTVYSMPIGGAAWTEEIGFDGHGYVLGQGGGVDDLGRIIIFGGDDPSEPGNYDKPPFEWNPIEGPWHDHAARGAAAPAVNFAYCTDDLGRIYSIGGGAGEAASPGNPNSTYCERYLGSAEAWEVLTPTPFGVANAAATPDGLGHILVFGGVSPDGSSRTNEVLRYDIAADSWSSTANANMPVALSDHRATLGADGRIYVLGGASGPVGAGTVERTTHVYDPLTDTWAVGPDMAEARRNFGSFLGSDDRIYVIGGANSTGGSFGVESLYGTPCPLFNIHPQAAELWQYARLTSSVQVAGGGTIAYQWMRNGVPLADGLSAGGGVISGALSDTLTIESIGADDSGVYTVRASNACGDTTSSGGVVTVRVPPEIPLHWTWTSLHPSYAEGSYAMGVDNGVQVGRAIYDTPDYNNIDHPTRWDGTAASAQDLTQGGSQGGSIIDFADDKLVGWWWRPTQCYVGGQWQTCYFRRGCWWNLDGTFHETNYSGYEYTIMSATDGVSVVGSGTTDDDVGNYFTKAVIWQAPTHEFAYSIHPAGFPDSSALAVEGEFQYGNVSLPFQGLHAAKWNGSGASFVDMHPDGLINSNIVDASDGQQVGVVNLWNNPHAAIWYGTPGSFLDLNPPAATESTLSDCDSGLQIGLATFPGGTVPGIWAGRAETFVDLSGVIPDGFTGFNMAALDVAPDGSIQIVGSAYNTAAGRAEAILLSSSDTPPCVADLNGDGVLDLADINLFIAGFVGHDPIADLTADGIYDLADINLFVGSFLMGCP